MKSDVIISINVHEKPEYLIDQIQNINQFVLLKKKIILNCNHFMYDEMKDKKIDNVVVNPIFINKQKNHGSLTHGIISNMAYALDNYDFQYFLVMSSREFFYNVLENVKKIEKNSVDIKNNDYSVNTWHWPIFKQSKLYQYLQTNNLYYSWSAHEGLCLSYKSCSYVIDFLNQHKDIMEDLFNFPCCVEEFAIQSICVNFSQFYYVGNGIEEKTLQKVDNFKLTHKRIR
jgi:hypothetical protein